MNTNNKIRIAIFTDSFLPGTGGTENAVLHIATTLTNQGHQVMVCCPNYWKYTDNFCFLVNRCKSIKTEKNCYLGFPSFSKNFKKAIKDFKPNIIHTHTNSLVANYGAKYAKKHKIPLLCTIHTKFSMSVYMSTKSKIITHISNKLLGKFLKKADMVSAVSKDMKEEFAKYGYYGNFEVIKNGVELKSNTNTDSTLAKKIYKIERNKNTLLFVGHVGNLKNLNFIYETLKLLQKKGIQYKMIFAGSLDDKKLINKMKKSEIKENIIFTGNITNKNLLNSIYENSTLFFFPSIFDNDSLSIIESATHKVPSIVIKGTGSSERITNDINGFIIDNNPISACDKITYLFHNPEKIKTVGENASTSLISSWDETVRNYLKLYEKLIFQKENL